MLNKTQKNSTYSVRYKVELFPHVVGPAPEKHRVLYQNIESGPAIFGGEYTDPVYVYRINNLLWTCFGHAIGARRPVT